MPKRQTGDGIKVVLGVKKKVILYQTIAFYISNNIFMLLVSIVSLHIHIICQLKKQINKLIFKQISCTVGCLNLEIKNL